MLNWKKFEVAVFQVISQLSKEASVQYNYKVRGKYSQRSRQVDVAIFDSISGIDLFIAVECKDLNRPVDIKDVESFLSMLDDISADKGIMVSSNGFTKAAQNSAISKKLQLFTLSAEDANNDVYIEKPVLITQMTHHSYRIITPNDLMNNPVFNFEKMSLYTADNKHIYDINHYLLDHWNQGLIPNNIGSNTAPLKGLKTMFHMKYYDLNIEVLYTVRADAYKKDFKLMQLLNYSDVLKNEIVTSRQYTEEYFDPDPILDSSYNKITFSELHEIDSDDFIDARLKFNLGEQYE